MKIYRAKNNSAQLSEALSRLIPQLSPSAQIPISESIQTILQSNNTHLLLAEHEDIIVGMLSLVIVDIPTGRKAWIEDVVVENDFRGQNVGYMLVEKAKEVAVKLGAKKIYLTSNPSRKAAHGLYAKCGFEEYNTTLFRINFPTK